jgi:hypothetical protein
MKLRRFLSTLPAKFGPALRSRVKRFAEGLGDDYGGMDHEAEDVEDPAELSAGDHLKMGVHKACHAVLADEDLGADEKAAKIKGYLKAHEKLEKDDDDDAPADPAAKAKRAQAAGESRRYARITVNRGRTLTEHGRRGGISPQTFARKLRGGPPGPHIGNGGIAS